VFTTFVSHLCFFYGGQPVSWNGTRIYKYLIQNVQLHFIYAQLRDMAPPWSPVYLILPVLLCVLEIQAKFVNFNPRYEYQYVFHSDAEIRDVGKFKIQAKVSDIFVLIFTFKF